MPSRTDTQREAFETALRALLAVLSPYSADIVVIGGWVPELYRKYGNLGPWEGTAAFTREADLLLAERILPSRRRASIPELLQQAKLQPFNPTTKGTAVWLGPGGDTAVEFLVPTTLLRANPVTEIAGQPGLAAIARPYLDVMQKYTRFLLLPDRKHGDIKVRVPLFGAWVLSKAVTFAERPDPAGDPKRGKDIAYLRDVMRAGDNVLKQVAADLGAMTRRDDETKRMVRQARRRLGELLEHTEGVDMRSAASQVAESEGLSRESARTELEGRLRDLHQLLQQFSGTKKR